MEEVEAGSAAAAAGPSLLCLEGITKSFAGVEVLHGVDLDCWAGEVHAVVGENGAGKSTLMKVVAGAHQPDSGNMMLGGEPVRFSHPREAQAAGVSIIYQEFNLLNDRTVAQNIYLGREPTRGPLVDHRQLDADTSGILEQLNARGSISPQAKIHELSIAKQQLVEIAKALSFDARILIMDEPTASLAPTEVEALFGIVEELRQRGMLIFYVSHRMQEVFTLAQRVTVLKDGHHVDTRDIGSVTPKSVVKMMVGRELSDYYPQRAQPDEIGDVRLRVAGAGNAALSDIDFEVRAGEIVGLAGLEGSGRTEVAEAVFGSEPFTSGTVEIDGTPAHINRPRRAIERRVGFVTEDRKAQGLVMVRSADENSLLTLRALTGRERRERAASQDTDGDTLAVHLAKRVDLRAASLDQEVRFLSGGNQQKVVFAKWLASDAHVLLFDEPTRGIDVGAKAGIHNLMRGLARRGAAVLMISSELPEVIGMSDRVLVMSHGQIAGELPAGPSEADVMLLATGQADVVVGQEITVAVGAPGRVTTDGEHTPTDHRMTADAETGQVPLEEGRSEGGQDG